MSQTPLTKLAILEYHKLLRKYREATPLERLDLREQVSSTSEWFKRQGISASDDALKKSLLEVNHVSAPSNN